MARWLEGALVALALCGCEDETTTIAPEPSPAAAPSSAAPEAPEAPEAPVVPKAEAGVRAVFAQYKKALLARDGDLAARSVDKKTLELYQSYLDLAKTVDRKGLHALDLFGKIMVLRLRHELDGPTLSAATGRAIFVSSVEKGWISDDSVRNAEIAKINIDGTAASMSIARAPGTPAFFFYEEDDGWKLALSKTMSLAEPVLRNMMAKSGASDEVAFVVAMIEALSPRKFDPALLSGPPSGTVAAP